MAVVVAPSLRARSMSLALAVNTTLAWSLEQRRRAAHHIAVRRSMCQAHEQRHALARQAQKGHAPSRLKPTNGLEDPSSRRGKNDEIVSMDHNAVGCGHTVAVAHIKTDDTLRQEDSRFIHNFHRVSR